MPQMSHLSKYLSQILVSMAYMFGLLYGKIYTTTTGLSHSCRGLVTYQTHLQSISCVRSAGAVVTIERGSIGGNGAGVIKPQWSKLSEQH